MNVMDKVFEKTLTFIGNYVEIGDTVSADSQLIADLGFNSLTLLDMVNDAEDEFGISISDDELPGIVTIGDVVELLKRKNVDFS